jgi:hypothetical protein
MPNAAALQTIVQIRTALAGRALTPQQAKLYSQRLRLDSGGVGLSSFSSDEANQRLDDALLLLQTGLIERSANPGGDWRASIKRAAEILEWLSQDRLKPKGVPLHLLAAGAYQAAEYPAMALGHLRTIPSEPTSKILREFLRANFAATLDAVRSYWRNIYSDDHAVEDTEALTSAAVKHVIMCIGTIATYIRVGRSELLEEALIKLDKLAVGFLYSRDSYSYLLATLTAVAARRFVAASLWPKISALGARSSPGANNALVQFSRSAFVNSRAIIWPAQAAGIDRLLEDQSFVLCTPTGSGKTTIATLAVIQALFHAPNEQDLLAVPGLGSANLVLYLVPSRALAAEVEQRFAQDLRGIAATPLVVTGLYGGVDWGPTDAWIQSDSPTVLICTFEKADALIRYLGLLFLNRVRLVVIDEVHMVENQREGGEGLDDGPSRSFRLEQLGSRLYRARQSYNFRVVGLSAVAANAAPALARWIAGSSDARPVSSDNRSTRQMLGRLEVSAGGAFSIRYDLMDGRSLRFDDERSDETPYVPTPFPPLPGGLEGDGPEVRMRAPTFWAALQLATRRPDGSRPSVLISLTQHVGTFAQTCADLIERWPTRSLPNYWAGAEDSEGWERCLASAADYFSEESAEYRLLRRGIAVHHGKMPGLLARRLKLAIDRGWVRVIIATSTLSEGVNMPVNVVLLPSIHRGPTAMNVQEFTNLIGRAGRPGFGVEGSALVVLPEPALVRDRRGRTQIEYNRQRAAYDALIERIETSTEASIEGAPEDRASSTLAQLLNSLREAWSELTGSDDDDAFEQWLEETAVVGVDSDAAAYGYLETLDSFLIAAIEEVEQLRGEELPPTEIEAELRNIWRRTYAYAASHEEEQLGRIWLGRGVVIKIRYPDAAQRQQIYKTSLLPRSAVSLLAHAVSIKNKLQEGRAYADWNPGEQFEFITSVIEMIAEVPSFRIGRRLGRRRAFSDWKMILRWWLAKETAEDLPAPDVISNWYDFVASNFIYRATWGLGSLIGVLLNEVDGDPVRAIEIDDWPRSELPWIAFWLKELITWGTLDPVAAYLLARGNAINRPRAEASARSYYAALPQGTDPNDQLDPRRIRDWVAATRDDAVANRPQNEIEIFAELERPVEEYKNQTLTVMPLDRGDGISWIDPAGYIVARSSRPERWVDSVPAFEFKLNVGDRRIVGTRYLEHA